MYYQHVQDWDLALKQSNTVQRWKRTLLCLCFCRCWRAVWSLLLTSLCFLWPHSAYYWAFFCVLMKRKGEQIRKKTPGSWRFWLWGACQSALARCGLMEFNLNPASAKAGCSDGLGSSCLAKCWVIFMTARLILEDWIYEKYRTIWLQPHNLGTQGKSALQCLWGWDELVHPTQCHPKDLECGPNRKIYIS